MKFVSLISRPLGHPAALCFSRLAGLNRRPQSCRTKFIEEWHFSGQLWTHYIWHHFNWEKIGALPILSQENHISCCFLYISGIFQGIWLNSNNQTNLLQNSRANTSQGINCISAADTKEFGPQNRAGIFLSTKARCHRPRTPDSLQGSGPFFSPKLWLAGFGRNLTEKKHDQTHKSEASEPTRFLFNPLSELQMPCFSPSKLQYLTVASPRQHLSSAVAAISPVTLGFVMVCSFHLRPRFC